MLKKLYVNNFKCLVNFELDFEAMNLFLGNNGGGKSTVFEVLRRIQMFVNGQETIKIFPSDDITLWQTSPLQNFELLLEGNQGRYRYKFDIRHDRVKQINRVFSEKLWFDEHLLFELDEDGEAHLYRDNYSAGPTYPCDWHRSAVASLPERHDNTKLTWFKKRMKQIILVQLIPSQMTGESLQEEEQPTANLSNFVSWYRYVYQDQGKSLNITRELHDIWDDFSYFKLEKVSEQNRVLKAYFTGEGIELAYRFDQLSEGQRALIALYSLIHYTVSSDYTLCIDEPENFLALPEIQPWLTLLYDLCSEKKLQALLISHHPELIDYLALSVGYWFDRTNYMPTRVKRITEDGSGLPISELIARGWLHV